MLLLNMNVWAYRIFECHTCAQNVDLGELVGEYMWPTLQKMWTNELFLITKNHEQDQKQEEHSSLFSGS